MSTKKPIVETEEERKARETVETISKNIISLSKAVNALLNGGPLKKKALVLLLASSSGCAQWQVEAVLKAVEDMEKDWLNSK